MTGTYALARYFSVAPLCVSLQHLNSLQFRNEFIVQTNESLIQSQSSPEWDVYVAEWDVYIAEWDGDINPNSVPYFGHIVFIVLSGP